MSAALCHRGCGKPEGLHVCSRVPPVPAGIGPLYRAALAENVVLRQARESLASELRAARVMAAVDATRARAQALCDAADLADIEAWRHAWLWVEEAELGSQRACHALVEQAGALRVLAALAMEGRR